MRNSVPRFHLFRFIKKMKFKGIFMRCISVCLVAVLLAAGSLDTVSAQTTTAPAATPAPATTDAKPSKMKLTMEKLKEMKAKWMANRPKFRACRKEVRAKGLTGDDRWFYISDCMERS